MYKSILFLSKNVPDSLFKLVQALPLVEPRQSFIPVEDVGAIQSALTSEKAVAVVIDAHHGDFDMQYLREIIAKQASGIDAMRLHVAKGKFLPESIILLRLVKVLQPKIKVMYLIREVTSVNLEEMLKDLGADIVMESTERTADIANALATIATSVTNIGASVHENVTRIKKAATDLRSGSRA